MCRLVPSLCAGCSLPYQLPFLICISALQTDNNINELMERVSIGSSKVVQGAGRAVKLLGKLARGLGGGGGGGGAGGGSSSGSSEAPNAAVAARASSYGTLAATGSTPIPSAGAGAYLWV